MKKFFAVAFLLATMILSTVSVQAENFEFTPLSYIYGGRVVNIKTYLSVREYPNVNSREIMRIPNGAELSLHFTGNQDWWQVLSINGNTYGVRAGDAIGWVSARYVRTY